MLDIFIYSKDGKYIGEISDEKIISAVMHEEINGEHSLTLSTTKKLEKGYRLVFNRNIKGQSKWYEFAVTGVDGEHSVGENAFDGKKTVRYAKVVYTYYCVWSLQEDLQGVLVSVMPGVQSPVNSNVALSAILSTQSRWTGSGYYSLRGGASMYDRSAWDALCTLVENWGGRLSASITVDPLKGVTSRTVSLIDPSVYTTVEYRFDFGANMSSITRSIEEGPRYCRISPRGKGERTEGGGYGRKITIASVNNGKDYLEYSPAVPTSRIKNPDGSYIYPTLKVENSKCETPAELKEWAQSVLEEYCTPNIVYTVREHRASAVHRNDSRYERLGIGSIVQVVDSGFDEDEPLRFESVIVSVDRDLLDDGNTVLQISSSKKNITTKFASPGGTGGGANYATPSVSSSIGGVEPVTSSGVNAATGTNTDVCSLSLPAGVWMLSGQVGFPVNATGRRAAKISTVSGDTANVISTVVQDAVTGALTRCSTTRCLSFANQTTVYLIGYQTSGETLSCSGQFEATRIA